MQCLLPMLTCCEESGHKKLKKKGLSHAAIDCVLLEILIILLSSFNLMAKVNLVLETMGKYYWPLCYCCQSRWFIYIFSFCTWRDQSTFLYGCCFSFLPVFFAFCHNLLFAYRHCVTHFHQVSRPACRGAQNGHQLCVHQFVESDSYNTSTQGIKRPGCQGTTSNQERTYYTKRIPCIY